MGATWVQTDIRFELEFVCQCLFENVLCQLMRNRWNGLGFPRFCSRFAWNE
jgi:hypothetical protein